MEYILTIMPQSMSNHALLCLTGNEQVYSRRTHFKYLNCVASMEGFNEAIEKNWREPISGRPVYVIWKKLQRLQPSVRKLSKPIASINIQLERARTELRKAQQDLMKDIMNPQNIEKVKECTKDVIK